MAGKGPAIVIGRRIWVVPTRLDSTQVEGRTGEIWFDWVKKTIF